MTDETPLSAVEECPLCEGSGGVRWNAGSNGWDPATLDAARASAVPEPRWKFDSQCEITNENHEQGEACAPFTPHSHRAGQIKWARPFPPLDETDLGAAYVELQERFIAFGDEVGARASAPALDERVLDLRQVRGIINTLPPTMGHGAVSRIAVLDIIDYAIRRLAAARLPTPPE